MITILSDKARDVEVGVDDGKVLVRPELLDAALGWTLEPQGLCRGDVCVPVADPAALTAGGLLDVRAVAAALGSAYAVDPDEGLVALGIPAADRSRAINQLEAPEFTLDDLDGNPRSLSEWRGNKRLLFAFATW